MWMIWTGFVLFVLLMLALDLGVFHRKAHIVGIREALAWSAVWIVLGLAFSLFVYHGYEQHWLGLGLTPDAVDRSQDFPDGRVNDGRSAVLKYLTGYVVEKSLSVDNVFVIAMIFGFLAVPPLYQHRVLFWGILGALVMRGAMIAVGARLIAEFSWILMVFGVFLIATAVKMLLIRETTDPNATWAVRLTRRFFPVTERFHGEHFLVRAGSSASREAETPGAAALEDAAVARARPGTCMLTPLALALIMVETSDLIFAVDSIPAIFAITADPFLVFTSNVFAILGLRSLYFALAGAISAFRYLKVSLALVLALVGFKMLAHSWLKSLLGPSFNLQLLLVVLGILALGVLASWLLKPRPRPVAARGLCLAALLVGLAAPARAGELRASLEAGAAWQSRNDFRIPGDAGTLVDLAAYESGPFAAFRGTLTLDLTPRQSLRLLAAPLRVETTFTPESAVAFQDLVFPAGQPLEATYVFNSYRLTWYWRFPPGEKWSFRLGATLKLRDAQIALAGAPGRSAKDDLGLVPLLHVAARYQATERFALELEADALAAPQGRAEDVSLKGVIRLSDRVEIDFGYRLLEGGADNDEVYTFAFFHYAVAGLRIRL